jgi:hypothetical protein
MAKLLMVAESNFFGVTFIKGILSRGKVAILASHGAMLRLLLINLKLWGY